MYGTCEVWYMTRLPSENIISLYKSVTNSFNCKVVCWKGCKPLEILKPFTMTHFPTCLSPPYPHVKAAAMGPRRYLWPQIGFYCFDIHFWCEIKLWNEVEIKVCTEAAKCDSWQDYHEKKQMLLYKSVTNSFIFRLYVGKVAHLRRFWNHSRWPIFPRVYHRHVHTWRLPQWVLGAP